MDAVTATYTMLAIALPVMFSVIAIFIFMTIILKKIFPGKLEDQE